MPTEETSIDREGGSPKADREDGRRSKKDTSVPFDPTKDSLVVDEDTGSGAITKRSRRHSSSGRRRSSGGGNSSGDGTPQKKSSDAAADRPSLEGIFNDSDDGSNS
ncbi:unnamed protein product, partial [Ectocarpus sp. 12 AP-2014]